MGIKKKIFLAFSGGIFVITLLSYSFIFILFRQGYETEIMRYQKSAVSMNSNMVESFLDSIRQTSLRIIGDEAIGIYLSTGTVTDSLEKINIRRSITNQFSHYSTDQILGSSLYLKNTLFINDSLPIADFFDSRTLNTNPFVSSSNIFSDTEVKTADWYLQLMESGKRSRIFLDPETNNFCFAQIIHNNYYTGPYTKSGQGVMVISIASKDLSRTFSLEPISDNSGYAIFTSQQELLFLSNDQKNLYLEACDRFMARKAFGGETVTLGGQRYVMSLNSLERYDLKILFLTPYRDIQTQLSHLMRFYLLFVLLIFFILMAGIYLISNRFTRPIIRMAQTISTIHDTRNFSVEALHFSKDKEIVMLCDSFSQLITHNNQLIRDIQTQTEQQKRSELRALQAQINPHFIFNAMDIVNWMALSKNEDDIAEIVSSIANLMRYSITEPDKLVPVLSELQNIQEYINIQQLRHSQKLILKIDTAEDLNSVYIPKFTLQPLIENSISHGLVECGRDLHIQVHVYRSAHAVIIDITDDGVGCDALELNKFLDHSEDTSLKVSNGFGIRNINERIRLNFKGESGLIYRRDSAGILTARITFDNN